MGHLVVTNVINGSFACGERMGANTHTHMARGERPMEERVPGEEGDATDR